MSIQNFRIIKTEKRLSRCKRYMFLEKKKNKQITKNVLLKFDPELENKYTSIGESQIRFKINDYRPYHFE